MQTGSSHYHFFSSVVFTIAIIVIFAIIHVLKWPRECQLTQMAMLNNLIKTKRYSFFGSSPCFSYYIITDASPSSTHSFHSAKLLNPPPLTCPLPDCVCVCVCAHFKSLMLCSTGCSDTSYTSTTATHTLAHKPTHTHTHAHMRGHTHTRTGHSTCWHTAGWSGKGSSNVAKSADIIPSDFFSSRVVRGQAHESGEKCSLPLRVCFNI